MAKIMIGNKVITSPEQFADQVKVALSKGPARYGCPADDIKAALREIVGEWRAAGLDPEHSLFKLSVALADFAAAVGLTEDDVQELLIA